MKRNCSSAAAVAASLGVEVFCRPGMSGGGKRKRWKRKNKGAFPPPLSFLERCPYFFGRLPLLATYLASDLGGGEEKGGGGARETDGTKQKLPPLGLILSLFGLNSAAPLSLCSPGESLMGGGGGRGWNGGENRERQHSWGVEDKRSEGKEEEEESSDGQFGPFLLLLFRRRTQGGFSFGRTS